MSRAKQASYPVTSKVTSWIDTQVLICSLVPLCSLDRSIDSLSFPIEFPTSSDQFCLECICSAFGCSLFLMASSVLDDDSVASVASGLTPFPGYHRIPEEACRVTFTLNDFELVCVKPNCRNKQHVSLRSNPTAVAASGYYRFHAENNVILGGILSTYVSTADYNRRN